MRTVTVSSIVTNAASRAGLDGSVSIDNLPTTTKTIMVDNLRHRTCAMPGSFTTGLTFARTEAANGTNRSGRRSFTF
jgi:hypothetical protein